MTNNDFMSLFPANMNREDYARNYGKQIADRYKDYGDPTPTEAMGQDICRLQFDKMQLQQTIINNHSDYLKSKKADTWICFVISLVSFAMGLGIGFM